jgi:hypothetical protein
VRRAQAVRRDAREDGLHVLRQHLVASFDERPGARRMHQRERGARRKPGDVVGRTAGVLDDRLHVVKERRRDVDALHRGL